ncbi:MAG: DUF3426 domain-containing protein [Burkholderiales bacterium]
MSLITRCPTCGTAFRVQRDQLAARSGAVRCGKCGNLFDGVSALVDDSAERLLALDPSPQLGLFDPSRRQPPGHRAAVGDQGPPPAFLTEQEPAPRRTWLWVLLSLVAACGLLAQAYRHRSELTMLLPELRPALEALCRSAGCDVPLPQSLRLVAMVSSDMHQDPEREGVVVFHALLRNNARFSQRFPVLQLTLTLDGKPVTRRLLGPVEYLPSAGASQRIAQGIPAGGEESLRIYLDSRAAKANGYRVCLYPRQCLESNE